MSQPAASEFIFQHLIDLPDCECVFCSTRQASTGRTRLFLIFNNKEKIYQRNGIHETWDEVRDTGECLKIRKGFNNVVEQRSVPCFSL